MKNRKTISGLLCFCALISTGCAGLLPGYCGACADSQAGAFFADMAKYTDQCYVSRAIRNTAYPGINYISRIEEEKREKDGRQKEYAEKMRPVVLLALAGLITGGVIGYYSSLEPNIDLGDVRWLGAFCGAALGVMPAGALYYIIQWDDVLQ